MNLPKKTQRQRASEAVNVLDSVFALVLPEKVETLQRIVDVWDESTDTFIVNGLIDVLNDYRRLRDRIAKLRVRL